MVILAAPSSQAPLPGASTLSSVAVVTHPEVRLRRHRCLPAYDLSLPAPAQLRHSLLLTTLLVIKHGRQVLLQP